MNMERSVSCKLLMCDQLSVRAEKRLAQRHRAGLLEARTNPRWRDREASVRAASSSCLPYITQSKNIPTAPAHTRQVPRKVTITKKGISIKRGEENAEA